MQVISLVWGVLVLVAMFVGHIPYFSSVIWVLIPLAALGIAMSALALVMTGAGVNRTAGLGGLITNTVAFAIGLLRMFYGGGIL